MMKYSLMIALVLSFGLTGCASHKEHHDDDDRHGVSVYGNW
jgi:hypothetical protein